ncbi:TetR/AcrR family transcriptional regulator [Pseudonocardia sp. C8]|uniref:TetR/AcrR family transcriptional regulator n=1 Tax=Pseudonocardia sp. C8 TaxID=2762759 RepID=UPI0016425A09|nr:TetR/AcrR family transcriptional regulator [Pseudonocardia sp. C8]MBC3193486.1 TetR/AcrR family transcriptional regulator [Pseudonocardia sp. C8]
MRRPRESAPAATPRRRWLDAGLDLLATSGITAVTIEALCERLGLSKGSFYHHFAGMTGYRTALLEHFEERETRAFIDLVEELPAADGTEKLRALVRAIVADDAHDTLEPRVRTWAGQDDEARRHLERVDRTRVAYVRRQCRAAIDDTELADDVATMIYLVMVGAGHTVPQVLVAEQARLWERLIEVLEARGGERDEP